MLNNPFTIGLLIGLALAGFLQWRNFMLRLELRRYRQHLSDRMELEADALRTAKTTAETLRAENENLRIRIAEFNQLPERRVQRDLEVYARAEKQMLVSIPGFAGPWEAAKKAAHEELQQEENGRSLPRRVFTRLFGLGGESPSLPAATVVTPAPSQEG